MKPAGIAIIILFVVMLASLIISRVMDSKKRREAKDKDSSKDGTELEEE